MDAYRSRSRRPSTAGTRAGPLPEVPKPSWITTLLGSTDPSRRRLKATVIVGIIDVAGDHVRVDPHLDLPVPQGGGADITLGIPLDPDRAGGLGRAPGLVGGVHGGVETAQARTGQGLVKS